MVNKLKNISVLQPLDIVKKIYNYFTKTDKLALVCTFASWMLVHLFVFVNDFFVYDSVRLFDSSTGLENGRFLIYPILLLFANCQIPLIIGIVSGIFVSFSSMLLCRIFKIDNPIYTVLLSLTLVSFPVMYANNAFLSSAHIYTLALLLSVLAAYYTYKNTLRGYAFAALFVIASLACYQAYLPFAVCLVLLMTLVDSLNEKKPSELIKRLVITGVVFVIAVGIYYCIWQSLVDVFNITTYEYRGESEGLATFFSLDIVSRMIQAYILGFFMMVKGLFYHGDLAIMVVGRIIKVCVLVLSVILLIASFKSKKHKFGNISMAILSIIGLPLGVGLIYVFSPFSPHNLMVFPVFSIWLLLIVLSKQLIEDKKTVHKVLEWAVVVLLILSILINVICGNIGYSILSSESKSAITFVTRIVNRVESTDGVDIGTNVCFVSDEHWFYNERLYENRENERTTAECFTNFTIVSLLGTPYVDALIWYINDNANYLELNYSYQDLQDGDYANNKQVQQLQPFPAKNCSVWVNNTLVVRL